MKANILVLATLMSASVGLVSCSPDKKKNPKIFRLPEPVIQKAEGEVSFNPFSTSVDRSLDLSDRLEFDSISEGYLQIEATCLIGSQTFQSLVSLPMSREIGVYEFIDLKLLAKINPAINTNCAFTFTGSNSSGSKQVFVLQGVNVTDNGSTPRIQILKNSEGEKTALVLQVSEQEVIQIADEDYNRISMQCTDLRFEQETSETRSNFLQLTANGPIFETNEMDSLKRPAQRCRIVALKKGRIVAISSSFVYLLERGLPKIEVTEIKTLGRISPQKKFPLAQITIQNNEASPLKVWLSKTTPDLNFILYTRFMDQPIGHGAFKGAGEIEVKHSTGLDIREESRATVIGLEAGQSAEVTLNGTPSVFCIGILAATVSMKDPYLISIEEDLGYEVLVAPVGQIEFTESLRFGLKRAEELFKIYPHEGRAACH